MELSVVQVPTGSSLLLQLSVKWEGAGYPHVWDTASKIQNIPKELCLSRICSRHKVLVLKFGYILELPGELKLMPGSDTRKSDSIGMGCILEL